MGNSQSNDTPKSPTTSGHPGAAASTPSSPFGDEGRASPHQKHQGASRRSQAQAGRPINPLTHSLVSSGGSPSTSTSSAHARATVSASPQRSSHTRARSATIPAVLPGPLPSSYRSDSGVASSADSKPSVPSQRSIPLSAEASAATSVSPDSKKTPFLASQPMDVPQPSAHDAQPGLDPDDIITGYSQSPYGLPPATFSRPPRLPLPIEEEVHTPGSPIITPQDVLTPLDPSGVDGALPRKASVLSSTTIDEDEDIIDNDTFAADSSRSLQVRVPTLVEWTGGGEKIFVTGTFCHWEKKMKLHHNKEKPGFSAYVLLPPGTHHLKFLVDGEMMTSNDLPTTVDWTNILVNYIEIVAPLPQTPAEPIAIPGPNRSGEACSGSVAEKPPTYESDAETFDAGKKTPVVGQDDPSKPKPVPFQQPSIGPIVITPTPVHPTSKGKPEAKPTTTPSKQKHSRLRYTGQIPEFLLDLDNYSNPEDERFQRASKAANHLPQPPSLPSFLGKSILNSSTPHKDDASVLVLPNHTVINHLATSSIKSGVLATSGTTRYRQKFLTTIMYKPTSDDG